MGEAQVGIGKTDASGIIPRTKVAVRDREKDLLKVRYGIKTKVKIDGGIFHRQRIRLQHGSYCSCVTRHAVYTRST